MNAPTLSFVTTIRHPLNSKDYARVERYLKNTLDSVQAQICKNFQIIVICNQIPPFHTDFPDVKFLKVDFPPPFEQRSATIEQDAIRIDRGTKHAIALLYIKKSAPSKFVMFFDADDLLSNKLSSFVEENHDNPGFFMEHGYSMKLGSDTFDFLNEFYKVNGNANIVRVSDLPIPTDRLSINSCQEDILRELNQDFIFFILGSHKFTKDWMAERRIVMKPVPFPGAIWIVGNLENRSRQFGQKGSVPISPNDIQEFTIPLEYLTANIKTRAMQFLFRVESAFRKIATRLRPN